MSPWRALLYASWRAFLHAIRRTPPARKIWVGPKSGVQKCTPDGVQKCTPCRESLFGVHFLHASWRAFRHASFLDLLEFLACISARQPQAGVQKCTPAAAQREWSGGLSGVHFCTPAASEGVEGGRGEE